MRSKCLKSLTFLLVMSIAQCQVGYQQLITQVGTKLLLGQADAGDVLTTIGRWIWQNPDTIRGTVNQLLESGLGSIPDNVTSAVCIKHVELYLEALLRGEDWAVRMFDAVGKPTSDLKDYSFKWLGDYEECIAVQAIKYEDPVKKSIPSHPYKARYCIASLPVGGSSALGPVAAQVGLCFPDTCSNSDVAGLIKTLLDSLPLNMTLPTPNIDCKERDVPLNDEATAVIVVVSLFVAIMLFATLYDVMIHNIISKQKSAVEDMYTVKEKKGNNGNLELTNSYNISHVFNGHINKKQASNGHVITDKLANGDITDDTELQNGNVRSNGSTIQRDVENPSAKQAIYKPGGFGRLLLSFSVYTNAKKILNAQQPAGTLTSLNGIRFLSMSWVILGHTISFGLNQIGNASTYFRTMINRFTFQAVANATVSVDTFFVLSGLLVAYLTLKEMKKRGGATKINWFMFYFHRFWRLTPPYMMFLMIYAITFAYWGSGPFWFPADYDKNICHKWWWTNLLYINNFIPTVEEGCMAWTWYLANDMQFYVISPIWLVSLFYSPIIGSVCCIVFIVGSIITGGIVSNHFDLGPNIIFSKNQGDFFTELYFKPWNRVAPYVIGIWTGYLLYKTNCKVKISKTIVFLGWTLSTGVALTVLYGLYNNETGLPDLSVEMAAFYNATSRTAWALCVAWMMFACATGYGGPVNAILSWSGFVPLSRLTYYAYLIHPAVLFLYFYSRKATTHMDDMGMVILYLGVLCVTYGVSFILSLAFESPMMALEKVLLGRKKHS